MVCWESSISPSFTSKKPDHSNTLPPHRPLPPAMVCGEPEVDIELLRRHTIYEGYRRARGTVWVWGTYTPEPKHPPGTHPLHCGLVAGFLPLCWRAAAACSLVSFPCSLL